MPVGPVSREEPLNRYRLTVTFEEAQRDPSMRQQYNHERVTAIMAGQDVWKARGYEWTPEDLGIPIDFYRGGLPQGHILGDELDGYQVYHRYFDHEQNDFVEIRVDSRPIHDEAEAMQTLVGYLNDLPAPDSGDVLE